MLTEKSKREVGLSSQIEALVRERRVVREDLCSSTEENRTEYLLPVPPGLPQRVPLRGPTVVSNVQIAPPRTEVIMDEVDSNNHIVTGKMAVAGSAGIGGNVLDEAAASGESWRPSGSAVKRVRKRARRRENVPSVSEGSGQKKLREVELPHLTDGDRSKARKGHRPPIEEQKSSHMAIPDVSGGKPVSVKDDTWGASLSGPIRPKTRKAPKTAVVCIKRDVDGLSYSQILRRAREKVPIMDLGITDTRIRWAANGSVLIEVAGDNKDDKADLLADKLKEALTDKAIVSRPIAKGELRLWGLDDSVCPDEVACGIADLGGCLPTDVSVGSIVRMNNGLGSVWIRCPLAAAVKVVSSGKVRIGWTTARIELLQSRPMQCFRCWNFGHMRNTCKAEKDRSTACFRCGVDGHSARQCSFV